MLIPATNEIKEYLNSVVAFSHTVDKQENLLQCLYRMGHGWNNNGKEYACLLYKDFAPYSFGFACYQLGQITISNDDTCVTVKGDPWMNGGLIYHGSGVETYSVQLTPSDGWSIHT